MSMTDEDASDWDYSSKFIDLQMERYAHLLSTTIKMVKIAAIIKTTIMVASLRMIQSNVPRGSSCCHDPPDLIS